MALFGKKKNNAYDEASSSLNQSAYSVDKLIIEQIKDDDEQAAKLVDKLKAGHPLIINFEGLGDFPTNKMLAFFTGAAYALDGKAVKINDFTFLFAKRVDFLDGTLQKFINNLPR